MINGFLVKEKYNRDEIDNILKDMIYSVPINLCDKKFINEDIVLCSNKLYTKYIDNVPYCIALDGKISNISDLKEFLMLNEVELNEFSEEEVVLKGYIKYGSKIIEHIRGSFSICIYDGVLKKIILFKDRVGSRDLFYYNKNDELFFSSKISNIQKASKSEKIIDNNILAKFLSIGISKFDSKTLFKDILYIKPGNYIEYDINSFKLEYIEYFKMRSMSHNDDIEKTILNIKDLLNDSKQNLNINSKSNKLFDFNKFKINCNDLYSFVDITESIGNIKLYSNVFKSNNNIYYTLIKDLLYIYPNLDFDYFNMKNILNNNIYNKLKITSNLKEYKEYVLNNTPLDEEYNLDNIEMKKNTYYNLYTYTFDKLAKINLIDNNIKFPLNNYMLIEYMYNIPYDIKWYKKNKNILHDIFSINKYMDNKIIYDKDINIRFNEIINNNNSYINKFFNISYILNCNNKTFYYFGECLDKNQLICILVQLEYYFCKNNINFDKKI